jgi:hypothetical protein
VVEGEPLIVGGTGQPMLGATHAKTSPESHRKFEEKEENPKREKSRKNQHGSLFEGNLLWNKSFK